MGKRATILASMVLCFATTLQAQVLIEDEEGRIKIKQESVEKVTPLETMFKSSINLDFEYRDPVGEVWQKLGWPDEKINFNPGGVNIPAGELTGDGTKNFIRTYFNVIDDRDPSGETLTNKTLVFLGANPGTEPDQILYTQLIPVGDINANGKANAIAFNFDQSKWYIYEFIGTGFTTEPLGLDMLDWEVRPNNQSVAFYDVDGDGFDDVVFLNGSTNRIYILYGGASMGDLIVYEQQMTDLKPDEINITGSSGSAIIKDAYMDDGVFHMVVRPPLPWIDGRLALILNPAENKGFNLVDHVIFAPNENLGNNGLLRAVKLYDTEKHYLMWSYPLRSHTIMFPPSDEEGKIFKDEGVLWREGSVRPLGNLKGEGTTVFAGFGDVGVPSFVFPGANVNSGSVTGSPISSNRDIVPDLLLPSSGTLANIITPLFGDITGNGIDDYYLSFNSVEKFGQLLVEGNAAAEFDELLRPDWRNCQCR